MRKAGLPTQLARRAWIAFAHSSRRTGESGRNNAPCRCRRSNGTFVPAPARGAAATVPESVCASPNSVSPTSFDIHSTMVQPRVHPGRMGAVGPATRTGGDNYAAPVGMCVDWNTGVVMDLHRLRGRTFVVPCSGAQFDVDGSPLSTAVSGLQSAGDALIAADGNLMVWHRPRAAKAADGSRPAVTARAGGYANVTTAHVPDKAVVLRSRRD